MIAPLRQIEALRQLCGRHALADAANGGPEQCGQHRPGRGCETESYEVGATLRPTSRIDVDATWWRADNTNEVRGIPPGGVQFESLGASKRDGASVDVRWFVFSGARVYGGLSWVKARLLTPATPGNLSPGYSRLRASDWSTDTAWPTRHAGRALRRDLRARVLWPEGSQHRWNDSKRQVSARHVPGGLFAVRARAWVGGFFYPGSRYGESEYLFGSRVGVRSQSAVSATGGLTVTF